MAVKNKRILIFNVNWLGDVLFSTPVIRNLRRNFPDSFIACVVPSRCYHVLKDNPHLDEVILYDEKDRHRGLIAKYGFIRLLRQKKFDIVFLLHRSFSRALICWLAGIPERVGYNTKKRGALLTKKIPPAPFHGMHRIDYYLNVIEKAGLRVEDRYTEFFNDEKDTRFIEEFLSRYSVARGDFLVGINPGGNWDLKRWPKENWARLADELTRRFHAKVVITGGPSDSALAEGIQKELRYKAIIACGLNLKQSAALFKRLDLFISADSGPLHTANAVGTKKIVALFGPTSPQITGPFPLKNVVILRKDTGCKIPCYELDCKDNRCMKAISVEDVLKEL